MRFLLLSFGMFGVLVFCGMRWTEYRIINTADRIYTYDSFRLAIGDIQKNKCWLTACLTLSQVKLHTQDRIIPLGDIFVRLTPEWPIKASVSTPENQPLTLNGTITSKKISVYQGQYHDKSVSFSVKGDIDLSNNGRLNITTSGLQDFIQKLYGEQTPDWAKPYLTNNQQTIQVNL